MSAVSPGTTAGTDTSALPDGFFGVEDLLSLALQLLIPLLFLLRLVFVNPDVAGP